MWRGAWACAVCWACLVEAVRSLSWWRRKPPPVKRSSSTGPASPASPSSPSLSPSLPLSLPPSPHAPHDPGGSSSHLPPAASSPLGREVAARVAARWLLGGCRERRGASECSAPPLGAQRQPRRGRLACRRARTSIDATVRRVALRREGGGEGRQGGERGEGGGEGRRGGWICRGGCCGRRAAGRWRWRWR